MYTNKTKYQLYLLMCLFIFVLQQKTNAQIVIGTPQLVEFNQACANEDFNNFATNFVFSPESGLDASNQFSIEMSNANGDFNDSTIILTTNPGEITSSPATLNFSIPTTTAGENYRIRIKSSNPVATSSGSQSFPAYYKLQDSPFTINNLVSTGAYCSGGSYLLTIDNPGAGNNDSPLNYPTLNYNWYKETSATTSVFVTSGTTLSVNQEGTYFVETDYGTCTSSSFSNRVTISEVVAGETDAGISSSLGNPFCPDQGETILSTISGNSYQWFKDGEIISGATSQMYSTLDSGEYAVQVDLGDCSVSGTITLTSELFDGSINVEETNTLEEGESLQAIVITNANNPEFEWYLDNTPIAGATQDSYNVTSFGNYTVVVTETSGCLGSREFTFQVTEAFNPFPDVENIPNIISPNGDTINDTWTLPTKYVTGTNTEVLIMDNRGKIVFQTNDYLNNWPENDLELTSINQVFYYIITTQDNQVKKGSITIIK